jgi:hypothetical protein
MSKRRLLAAAVCAAAIPGLGASSAFAGEITGNGKETGMREHANSECGFSGLDDPDPDLFVHTQSWGQLPKEVRDAITAAGGNPGIACNGHLNPRK